MGVRLQDRAGELLFIGLAGTHLDAATRDLLHSVRPGGVILFRRNLEDAAAIARLTREIRTLFDPPPVLGIDQEGGRVSRLTPPFPALPTACRLGQLEMTDVCRWFGALTGRGLRSLGFQVDFAPVVDLSTEGAEDGIGDRAFAAAPEAAAERAGKFLAGLRDAGVAGCLKHFPGLGGAPGDTHQVLPRVDWDGSSMERALAPFRRLLPESPQVMVAHAHYPLLSGEQPLAASLDPKVVDLLLRQRLGYTGVVISDDLEMGAVHGGGSLADLAVRALAAGNDQVLVCQSVERVAEAHASVRQALAGGDLEPARMEASLQRLAAFKSSAACTRPVEPFVEEELAVVIEEMTDLGHEVDGALRRRGQ